MIDLRKTGLLGLVIGPRSSQTPPKFHGDFAANGGMRRSLAEPLVREYALISARSRAPSAGLECATARRPCVDSGALEPGVAPFSDIALPSDADNPPAAWSCGSAGASRCVESVSRRVSGLSRQRCDLRKRGDFRRGGGGSRTVKIPLAFLQVGAHCALIRPQFRLTTMTVTDRGRPSSCVAGVSHVQVGGAARQA